MAGFWRVHSGHKTQRELICLLRFIQIFFELSALAKLKELEGNNTKVNSKVDKGHKRGGATALHMKASSTAMGIWSLFPEAFFPARTFLNAFTAEINKKGSMLWTSVERQA